MSTNNPQTPPAAAEIPQPAPTLSPEAVVEQLRAIRAQIGVVTPLTVEQRKILQDRGGRTSNPVLQASINVLGAMDGISQVIGQPVGDVRQMHDEANRWTAVEDELRAMLSGVAGANLVRRQRVALIAAQAVGIGAQLTRDPANAQLLPHVHEVRRLKKAARRKKPAPPDSSPHPPVPETPKSSKT
jgi:hypothetical protein